MSTPSKASIEPGTPITITWEDESTVGKCHETTPLQAFKQLGFTDGSIDEIGVVFVDDVLWDLDRPLESDCDLFPIDYGDDYTINSCYYLSGELPAGFKWPPRRKPSKADS